MDPDSLIIALSARWHTYPERFHWIAEQGFALAYTPNPHDLDTLPIHLDPMLEAGVPVRHHGFFPGYEIGHPDPGLAARAMGLHLAALEAMHGRGEGVITVHIGLGPDPVDPGRAVENLTRLVERGLELGIDVSLENLRRGPTSNPETVVQWARASGTKITLDIGHAVSCRRVQAGVLAPIDFVDAFAERLAEVHVYERETDRHHPPKDMSLLGPIVDRLLATDCAWWTIELEECDEALATRGLLLDHVRVANDAQER